MPARGLGGSGEIAALMRIIKSPEKTQREYEKFVEREEAARAAEVAALKAKDGAKAAEVRLEMAQAKAEQINRDNQKALDERRVVLDGDREKLTERLETMSAEGVELDGRIEAVAVREETVAKAEGEFGKRNDELVARTSTLDAQDADLATRERAFTVREAKWDEWAKRRP